MFINAFFYFVFYYEYTSLFFHSLNELKPYNSERQKGKKKIVFMKKKLKVVAFYIFKSH